MNNVRVLDCTLRDGGHLNQGVFGKDVIINIIRKLVEAKVDIIEVGFLWHEPCDDNTARFFSIDDVRRILPDNKGNSSFSLMADYIDLENLEKCDGTIEYIRLSFKRSRLNWALDTAKKLINKGYKVFINPVNCNVYTDEQYLNIIRLINEIQPFGFSIVDTFGVMRLKDLIYRYSLVEKNLDKNITIGLHLHENLGLAYSLAQQFIQLANPQRNIVIDGSLLGMGRVPGNLCIEQIIDHLNYEFGEHYNVMPLFDAIDDYVSPIKKEIPWGYAIPYALSAKYNLHRTYAEYLMNKWRLRTSDIERILSNVIPEEAELFNESYIEGLYRQYMDYVVDDRAVFRELAEKMANKPIVLIAPGKNINTVHNNIADYVKRNNAIVIGINFVPNFVECNYIFFTNIKRYEVFGNRIERNKVIITSNFLRYGDFSDELILRYGGLTTHGEAYCEDSVLMALNFLKKIKKREVAIAGFDGIVGGKGEFYIDSLSRNDRSPDYSSKILVILQTSYDDILINFLTQSFYNTL